MEKSYIKEGGGKRVCSDKRAFFVGEVYNYTAGRTGSGREQGDPGSRKQSVCNYIRFPRE